MTTTKTARTRRIVRTPDPDETFTPGDVVCLVECSDQTGARWNTLTAHPRTNQSHEPRWDGWLGTTNNVSEWACGAWRVVSLYPQEDIASGFHVEKWVVSLASADVPEMH